MMPMVFLKWLILFLSINKIRALGVLPKSDLFSVNQRTMKTILESCYQNDSLSDPIVIFGDFNEFIDRPVIRIDKFLKVNKNHEKHQLSNVGAGKIILVVDSPWQLQSDLVLLKKTRWWNPLIPHFLIDGSNRQCEEADTNLWTSWQLDIINSIYICTKSTRRSELWTMNQIANHAPHPWRLRKTLQVTPRLPKFYMFSRMSTRNIWCQNLNYDKTKKLEGHEIIGVSWMPFDRPFILRKSYCHLLELDENHSPEVILWETIEKALNAKRRCELEKSRRAVAQRLIQSTADIMLESSTLHSLPGQCSLSPHMTGEMIAIVKLNPEVSTLQKIFKIWSIQVLILAGIVLAIFLLILILKSHSLSLQDFSFAILDLVRLLTYTSILTNNRGHSFRIYFTTMLIFMIISNGVFQGLIAAFLTTQERISAVETLDELRELGYKMHTQLGGLQILPPRCPKCHFDEMGIYDCIAYVINSTDHVCVMNRLSYEQYFILLPLDNVKQIVVEAALNFKCRNYWPLRNRVNRMIMATVEAGLVDHWEMQNTYRQKIERQEMEDEWSSAQYKPVRLYKLIFAFQLLAIGLSLSTIVFLVELLVAKYRTP